MNVDHFAAEIAYLTANLEERTRVVRRLDDLGALKAPLDALDAFEVWKIGKLAEKLGIQRRSESLRFDDAPSEFASRYHAILTDYARYWAARESTEDGIAAMLIDVHASWVGTYCDALVMMDGPLRSDSGSEGSVIPSAPFTRVCEPFLRLLQRDLAERIRSAEASAGNIRFSSHVIRDVASHLINRFELAMAWALEADISVYCALNNLDKLTGGSEGLVRYYDETFTDRAGYHRFYCKYPVLARWLAVVSGFLRDAAGELIERLAADASDISARFLEGRSIVAVESFRLGRSDAHAGGRGVVIVRFLTDDGTTSSVVYKPRGIESEEALQNLLAILRDEGTAPFATYRVLCKPGYGYAEYILPGRNEASDRSAVDRLYQQLGAYLAVFYILGGTDLHFENILVSENNAYVCDCETILGVQPKGMDVHFASFGESVYRTGMLEWPRAEVAQSDQDMRISGYSGGESYELPYAIPRINDQRESLGLKVEFRSRVRIEHEAPNRILFEGKVVDPREYQDRIVESFERVYDWFERQPEEAGRVIARLFDDASVRFVNWGTQIYTHLLVAARHPKCLAEPLEVDFVFNIVRYHRRPWDKQGRLLERELSALWSLDVPIFTAKASGATLIANHVEPLSAPLALSPVANAGERIRRLSRDNRLRQKQYIRVGLSPGEIQSDDFVATAEGHAAEVGAQLIAMMRPEGTAPWRTYELSARGTVEVDVGRDLYQGASGIGFFLAYLDAIKPDPTIRAAARRAINYALELAEPEQIGAFDGASGLVYVLTHVAELWDEPELLTQASQAARDIADRVDADRTFDVFGGAAGVLMVGLALEATCGDGVGLELAHRCADHLLRFAEEADGALSWPTVSREVAPENLSGFAHGTSGIGWALVTLGALVERSDYERAGRMAFAYDSRHFDPDERDWFDLRNSVRPLEPNKHHFSNAWCNGAAGIGLSRIASWAALGKTDDALLRDSYVALTATLRNFHKLGTDSLCHGRSGNGELFLRMALLKDEPALQMEANVQVQAQWRNHEQTRGWISSDRGTEVFPGLMLGLSGYGLHSLRLASPNRVPSPLLLDPPPRLSAVRPHLSLSTSMARE